MHDSLDIEQLTQRVRRIKRKTRWTWIWTLFLFLTLLVCMVGLLTQTNNNRLLHYVNNTWQEVPNLPGNPYEVKISPSGAVWLLNAGGISHWDGVSWQNYSSADLDAPFCSCQIFTLHDEEVWLANSNTVAHFDGNQWIRYPEARTGGAPRDIIAGEAGVYVVDNQGYLSHFDGERWTKEKLTKILTGVRVQNYSTPHLAETSDGSVWLEWNGLWQYDGKRWTEKIFNGTHVRGVRLVGQTYDELWLWGGDWILWTDSDPDYWGTYEYKDLGLESEDWIYQVVLSDETVLISTSRGIIAYDSSTDRWKPWSVGSPDGDTIDHLSAGASGDLWAVSTSGPNDFFLLALAFCALAAVIVGGLALLILAIQLGRLRRIGRAKAVEELHQLIPDFTGSGPRVTVGRMLALSLVFGIFGGIALVSGKEFFGVVLIIGLLLWSVWISLMRWQKTYRLLHSGQSPTLQQAFNYMTPLLVMVAWIMVSMLLAFRIINTGLGLLILLQAGFLGLVLFLGFAMWIQRAMFRGRPIEALNRIDRLERWLPDWFQFLRVTVHLFARQYAEAEQMLRAFIIVYQNSLLLQTILLNNLSVCLMEQGRYEEALCVIEIAISMRPELRVLWNTLAEVYLFQGTEPERALETAEFAWKYGSQSLLIGYGVNSHRAISLADRAWALAELGRHDETGPLLEQAFRLAKHNFEPVTAQLHYIAAQVSRLQKNYTTAIDHLTQAMQLDPQGAAGQRAETLLQTVRQEIESA